MKHLALLRGINVGGNNIIKKDALKALFESVGCMSVLTYIQSGNILFTSDEKKNDIQKKIEMALEQKMGKEIPVVLYNEDEYKKMMQAAPKEWNKNAEMKYNALFLLDGVTKDKAISLFPEINTTYESIHAVDGVLFWSGSKVDYAKTSYTKELAKSALYKLVTIRNGNTSLKLLDLFERV